MDGPYTLDLIDWKKYANWHGLTPVPFEHEDPLSDYAEDGVNFDDDFDGDEILFEDLFPDGYSELARRYTVAVFDPPADMSEDARAICDSIKWNNANYDVDRLKALGVEPIKTIKVSCVYIDDPSVSMWVTFEGDSDRIESEIVGRTVGGGGSHDPALYVEGEKMRPGDYLDSVADAYGGQFAVILEYAAAGVPFKVQYERELASTYFHDYLLA